jgi:2,4-dienoyl-CoA reductase-like NADH-dependent reductase (Old Yellow Enzyme family)
MKPVSLGHHKSIDAFRQHLHSIDPGFDCARELQGSGGPLAQPLTLYPGLSAGNRFAIHPMEGWDGTPSGLPSDNTRRRWNRFGMSGAKLIWGGEAFAVQADGRANPNQLYLNPKADVERGLTELREEVLRGHNAQGLDTDDLVIGLQLTHSGRFSRPEGPPEPRPAYRNPVSDRKFGTDPNLPLLTDGELESIGENFLRAAVVAHKAGFDFVDVKCCHSYLLHELLSARNRPGPYGGSFENRIRLFKSIVGGIRSECPGLELGVRLSLVDAPPYVANPDTRVGEISLREDDEPYAMGFGMDANPPHDFDLDEPFRFLREIAGLGINLVNLTLGSPYFCPHVQRPAWYPPSDGYLPPEDPLAGVFRHISMTRRVKEALPELILVGSGYSYLQEWLPYLAEHEVGAGHVDIVGIGRMVLSYPDLPLHVLSDKALDRRRICRTFSDCTTAPRNGLPSGCYPLDEHYKDSADAERLKRLKKRMRST